MAKDDLGFQQVLLVINGIKSIMILELDKFNKDWGMLRLRICKTPWGRNIPSSNNSFLDKVEFKKDVGFFYFEDWKSKMFALQINFVCQ